MAQKPVEAAEQPPGHPGRPYVLRSLCGEIIYIPCSKSAMRLLVTGKETDNAFAIVGTGGMASDPIGFHFHREAHDIFLCLKGSINVWADDQGRTLGPGDLASVPPNTVHQYQILGDYSEFVGLIVPGGWEEFFRFIGEPYNGPLFPVKDERNPLEVFIPKLKAAAEKFDMTPVPDHPQVDPQPWVDGKDNSLPGALKPYYLRSGTGPKYLLGGIVCCPLVTTAESAARFSIASVEGSSWHGDGALSRNLQFQTVHHAFQVADGAISLSLNRDQVAYLTAGEIIYIPRGTTFNLVFQSRYAKVYVFVSGAGLVDLLCRAGKPYHQTIPPERPDSWETSTLDALQIELGFRFSK
ncbi:uncharacterized protein Z518_07882 [Rhinocladiella mackenziei CBS 650.93]|uniref:Cupin type-2 domain-containing protein n=1 Tax=Rhinocladiella mackenziei CBS 650.93 TaxID=1442369 RepID=A0A0D2GUG2_9EURO|nr:uncharacterized protein Z518_07882 [Rhinocladiella mackenziei CBS 650.93]KIX01943.1 hypothetical protein Z518_07882 [Rhinocladiella mackenziei CBS 650.93]